MKALKCEMCGSNDVVKQDGLYVCQNCGTKYTVEEARKMIIEGTVDVQGTVKIDTSDELNNLYEIARRARDTENSENALKYYDMILIKDPNSWEANYYVDYYKLMNCRTVQLWPAARKMVNCQESVLNLIKSRLKKPIDQKEAIDEIFERNKKIESLFFNSARVPQFKHVNTKVYSEMLYTFGDCIIRLFGTNYANYAVESWKLGNEMYNELAKNLDSSKDIENSLLIINKYGEKIQAYDSSYIIPKYFKKSSSGCYVATAVYDSYNCPEVWTLRRFRDNTLDETWYGRAFIKTYYAISPTLVKWFGETSWFKRLWRRPLDKLVASLRSKGVEDSPYQDKY